MAEEEQTLRIFIETPSGDRFEADIPCQSKISQVAADLFEAQGWSLDGRYGQRTIIELVDPENPNNTKHLNGDSGLCASGLRNGDILRITQESPFRSNSPGIVSRSASNNGSPLLFDEIETWLHDSLKTRHTFRSLRRMICHIAWSPNGKLLASSYTDETICLWDLDTGQLSDMLPPRHLGAISSMVWSPNNRDLALAYADKMICLWNTVTKQLLHTLIGHLGAVNCIVWSPNGQFLASASNDKTIRLWDTDTKQLFHTFTGHLSIVNSVTWFPDGTLLASSAEDNTIRLWNVVHKQQQHILEGFIDVVEYLSFSFDGRFLASKSLDGTIRLWRSDMWEGQIIVRETPLLYGGGLSGSRFPDFAFHPKALTMAIPAEESTAIYISELNLETLPLLTSSVTSSVKYVNAKVVLLGNTGVGKTGLRLVLTGKAFIPTESTHGRYVWVFDNRVVASDGKATETQEILLWDLAGQPGYRLIHQLHLNEAVVALVVFDIRSEIDKFAGIYYWNRALYQAQRVNDPPFSLKKILVAARTDRDGIGVKDNRIQSLIKELGFDAYFETSAKEGLNIPELAEAIRKAIDWSVFPKVTSTHLFRRIRSFLIAEKNSGCVLSLVTDLYRAFLKSETVPLETDQLYEQFKTCIRLMESQGLIRRLHRGNCVLLQPELLDIYASALVNAVKHEPGSMGIIAEDQVKEAKFFIPTDSRLKDKQQEEFLLTSMVEDLLRQEVVLREQLDNKFHLIFPSQSSREYEALLDMSGKIAVFSFEGAVLNVYTTLAVRLSYSRVFKRKEIWENAVTYTTDDGGTYGILLENTGEGKGSLTIFFEDTSEAMSVYFENFVHDHLWSRVQSETIQRQRIFSCNECKTPLTNMQVQKRLQRDLKWIDCPVCDMRISLIDGENRNKAFDPLFVLEMNKNADKERELKTSQFIFQTLQKQSEEPT